MKTFNKGDQVYVANFYSMSVKRGVIDSELQRFEDTDEYYYYVIVRKKGGDDRYPFLCNSIYKTRKECIPIVMRAKANGTSIDRTVM